jgi:hypothetical protein
MAVFWVVAPCSLVEGSSLWWWRNKYLWNVGNLLPYGATRAHRPDDGGSKYLWNVGKLLPDDTALQPTRQSLSYSPPWKPEISPTASIFRADRNVGIYLRVHTVLQPRRSTSTQIKVSFPQNVCRVSLSVRRGRSVGSVNVACQCFGKEPGYVRMAVLLNSKGCFFVGCVTNILGVGEGWTELLQLPIRDRVSAWYTDDWCEICDQVPDNTKDTLFSFVILSFTCPGYFQTAREGNGS